MEKFSGSKGVVNSDWSLVKSIERRGRSLEFDLDSVGITPKLKL